MKSLEVTKKTDGSCSARYIYEDESREKMIIDELYGSNMNGSLSNAQEIITRNNILVYCFYDEFTENMVMRFLEKEVFVQINASLKKEELVEIAGGMEQRQMSSNK